MLLREPYTPPVHSLGQTVLLYVDGDRRQIPITAVIGTQCGRRVDIFVFEPQRHVHKWSAGILHIDDPASHDASYSGLGCWDHTAETKRLDQIEDWLEGQNCASVIHSRDNPYPEKSIEELREECWKSGIQHIPHSDNHIQIAQSLCTRLADIERARKKAEAAKAPPEPKAAAPAPKKTAKK